MLNYNKDMFDQIVQDYDQLKTRAEEVFEIRHKHLGGHSNIESIEFFEKSVWIETSRYCCGDTDYDSCSFPHEYLLMSDDEVHTAFAKEKADLDEQRRLEKEKKESDEKERQEAWKTQQLTNLLQEFAAKQKPLPPEFAQIIRDNYWYLITGEK